jgi:hypothetical protein
VKPVTKEYQFKTTRTLPKLGMMLVGLGGNNGSTLTAGLIANREGMKWRTPGGEQSANYFGSLLQVHPSPSAKVSTQHTTGAPPLLAGWDALSHSIPCSGRRPNQPALKMAGGRSLDTVPFPPAINWLHISSPAATPHTMFGDALSPIATRRRLCLGPMHVRSLHHSPGWRAHDARVSVRECERSDAAKRGGQAH